MGRKRTRRLTIKPEALAEARLSAGKSVQDVADHLNYTTARVYQWERGENPGLSPKTALKMAEFLDVPMSQITEIEKLDEAVAS